MASEPPVKNEDLARALKELPGLKQSSAPPKEFWPRFLTCLASLSLASRAVLLLRDSSQQPPRWRKIGEWSANAGASRFVAAFTEQLEPIAERCAQDGHFLAPLDPSASRGSGHYFVAVRLRLPGPNEECVAAFLLSEVHESGARESLLRLTLAADAPEVYLLNQAARQAKADVEKFAAALDLMVLVNTEKRFLAAALAFCNGVATHFRCDRASLGWLEAGYIRLQTISRTEKFDRQMAAAKALEVAMEESLDQDDEVIWPAPESSTVVFRDHAKFSGEQSVSCLCSFPLRIDGKAVAVLTCERQESAFTSNEIQQLRLCCDQVARRLADLKDHDRWFGARLASEAREQFAKLVGPEHTWAKILATTIALALAILFFFRVTYRVEGTFVLRSDEVSYLTAPFDGYIDKVFVRAGDAIPKDGKLVSLNTSELELEESAALADLNRYQREAEKARAAKALAEMRISQALAEQAKARLDMVRYRLEQAVIKSPFVGVIVEGDLRERLGAPVKQGDALFKVAKTETLYVEAEVNERDVHELIGKTAGEIAFVSQPKLKYPVRIITVEPAAVPKAEGNIFMVRCAVDGGPQPWWRPGMSGLCKLSVQKRTLFWILTHRTADFLRMKLWW